jgi:hypothetical protein
MEILGRISGFRRDVDEICDIAQRRVIILYRRFGTSYRSHFKGQEVQEEKNVSKSYHSTLRSKAQGRRTRTGFHEILYFRIFRKFVEKFQVSLNLTRITSTLYDDVCTFMIISR